MATTGESGRWRQVAGVLLAEVERLADPGARSAKLLEIGDVFRQHLGDAAGAARHYADSVRQFPEAAQTALGRLASLARETGDPQVVAHFIGALTAAERWVDVITVLVKQAEVMSDRGERAGLFLEAANLTRTRLGDAALAREYLLAAAHDASEEQYELVLEPLHLHLAHVPEDTEVTQAAARLETGAGRPHEAITLLSQGAAHVRDLQTKAALLLEAATLCGDHAALPVDAAVHAYEALVLDPDLAPQVDARLELTLTRWGHLPDVAATLEQIHERLGRPDRVHEVLAARLAAASARDRPDLLLRMAEHAEYQLLDASRAFDLYRQGLEEQRGEPAAFAAGLRRVGAEGVPGAAEAMIELFGRLGLWRALVTVHEGEAAVTVDDAARGEHLFRSGEILETHLEDLEGAMQHYLQAFKLRPRESRYMAAGERLYRRREDWPMVDRLLGLQVRVSDDAPLRRRLLLEQGRVRHRQLADARGAYESARAALAEGAGEAAMSLLGGLVREDESFVEIAACIRERAAQEGATEAARLLTELAALLIELRHDSAAGQALLREASELAPEDEALFVRVTEQLEQDEDEATRTELAEWLASAIGRPFSVPMRVAALRRAAAIFSGRLGQRVRARELLREAATLAPQDVHVCRELVAAARAAEDPLPLASVLARIAAGQMPALPELDHDGALRELAAVYERALGDVESAADCHRTLLSDRPADPVSLPWMRDFLTRGEAWEELRGYLDAAVATCQSEGQDERLHELWVDLAALAERRLGDLRLAASYVRPLWEATRNEDARDALHRLYQTSEDREGELGLLSMELATAEDEDAITLAEQLAALAARPPVVVAALEEALRCLVSLRAGDPEPVDRLLALLRAGERTRDLIDSLAVRAQRSPGLAAVPFLRERASLLTRAATDLDAAIAAWEAVLAHDAADDEALRYLQGIYDSRQDFDAAVAVLQRRIDAEQATGAKVALLRESAVQSELRLGDLARAASCWEQISALEPEDLDAVDERLRLYEMDERWGDFVSVAEGRLETMEPVDALPLAQQVARLIDDGPSPAALAAWQRIQAFSPRDAEAAAAIVRHGEPSGDWGLVAVHLQLLAEETHHPLEARRFRERQAAAHEAAGDSASALDAWRILNQAFPTDREVLAQMRRLAELRHDDWTLCRVLEAELQIVPPGPESVAISKALATRLDEGLGEQDNAAAVWERVHLAEPGDTEALFALKALYADLDRANDLVRVLRLLLDLSVDDDQRIERLVDSARLIETHRRDLAEAFECWWRAFKLTGEADPEMLREMGRLAEASGLWDRYIKVLEVARERARTREEQVEVLVQQAKVALERLKTPDKARALLKQAFEMKPNEGRVLDEYAKVCEQTSAWGEIIDACALLMRGVIDRDVRADLLLRTAAIMDRHTGEPERAFETYSQALRSGASDAAVLPELARLAEAHGYWEPLKTLYRERWQKQSQGPAKVATLHELARLLELRGKDWEAAFEQYLIALQLDPEDETTRAEAWRLAEAHGAWDLIIRVFELKVRDAEEAWLKIALLHDIAGIQERRQGQPEKAMETLRRAFAVETWNETTHASMRRLATESGRWRELAAAFEEEAGWAAEPHARLRLFREAATLLGEHGDKVGAARILRHVVELDTTDDLAATSLTRLLRENEDWAGLAAHLEGRMGRGVEDTRIATMHELIDVLRGPLEQGRKAEQLCARVLALRPSDPAAHEMLVRLLEARGDHGGVVEALDARARVLPVEQRAAILRKKAQILVGSLSSPREAFRVLARLSHDVPGDVDVVLEMSRLAEGNAEHEEILVCVDRTLPHAPLEQQPELLRLAGRTARDRFQNRKKARALLSRALELEPGDLALAREVLDLAAGERRWADVLALLERHGPELVAEPGEASKDAFVRWALQVALVRAERIGDVAGALEGLSRAAHERSDSPPLLERLRELALQAQAPEAVLWAVQAQVRLNPLPMVQLARLVEGARALEAMNAAELSIGLWQQVLSLDPHDEAAEVAVREYAARRRDWDLMASQIQQRIHSTVSPVEQSALICELAALHRDKRHDPQSAETQFARALEIDPKSLDAMEGLAALALGRADTSAISVLAERLVSRLDHRPPPIPGAAGPDPIVARAAPLLVTLQLFLARLAVDGGDETRGLKLLQDAWRRQPGREDVGYPLAELLYREAELTAAAEVYALLPNLPPAREGEDAGMHKAAELMRRARSFAAARDDERALRAFEAAAQEPTARIDALEAMANLQERAGHWEASIRLREQLATQVEDPRVRAHAWLAAGMVVETRLGKRPRALTYFDKAIQEGLDSPTLLRRLLPLYHEQQRTEPALALAARLLAVEGEMEDRTELHIISGECLERLGRRLEARDAFERACDLEPTRLPAVRGLLSTLARIPGEEFDAALVATLLARLWSGIANATGRDRVPALEVLGAALLPLTDRLSSLAVFEALHADAPDHLGAREALATLHARGVGVGDDPAVSEAHFEHALRHRLALLLAAPAEPASLRALVELCVAAGRPQWAGTPLRLLNLIRQATREEIEQLRSLSASSEERALVRLDAALRAAYVVDGEARTPTDELQALLFECIREPLDALLSGQAEDVEPAEPQFPHIGELVGTLCDALDMPRCPVWVRAATTQRLEAMQLSPLELVVDAGLIQGTNPRELRFQFARTLEGFREHNLLANGLRLEDARALFAATLAIALGDEGAEYAIRTGADPARIEFWAEFLVENLDEAALEAVSPLARGVSAYGPRAFEAWATRTRRLSNRVGFLLSGDLARAITVVQREDDALRGLRLNGADGFQALVEASGDVADLYRYAIGPRYFALLAALAAPATQTD